jgi:acetate kinase
MSTRAGSIDHTAVQALKTALALDDTQLDDYLNTRSGLLGLGGSDDIRTLLAREKDGDHRAELALQTYVYSIQKAIGQMTAALGGVDMLAFTGTVGERSMPIRDRITAGLHYLDLFIDTDANNGCEEPADLTRISKLAHSKPIYVVPTNEASEIASRTANL